MKLHAALWSRPRCETFGTRSFPRKRESTFSCPGRAKRDLGPRAVASGLWVSAFRGDERSKQQTPLIPAQAGIQGQGLGPRFRGDERSKQQTPLIPAPAGIQGQSLGPRFRGDERKEDLVGLRFPSLMIRSSASRQPRVVPWWPVPKASEASISTAMRLIRARPRACAPCTTNRPASTGARPSRLLSTQSVGASVSKLSAWAAAVPAADAISARTALASGCWRKWRASDQCPDASSKAATAISSAAGLPASASAIFCTVVASLESRATTVVSRLREGSSITPLVFSPLLTVGYPQAVPADSQNAQQLIRRLSTGLARVYDDPSGMG